MQQESGGNPRAINLWDSNAKRGTPSKGLMQVIDPTFRAYAMPGHNADIWDPLSNILASERYAMARYGSLSAAYNKAGGYELGTDYVPEDGLVRLHKGEAVVPAAANSGWTGGSVTLQLDGPSTVALLGVRRSRWSPRRSPCSPHEGPTTDERHHRHGDRRGQQQPAAGAPERRRHRGAVVRDGQHHAPGPQRGDGAGSHPGRQPADDEQQRGPGLRLRDAVRGVGHVLVAGDPGNVTTPVVVPETRIWLVHPGVPEVSTPITLRPGSLAEESFPVTQGVFYPMGRTNPVVVNGGVRHGSQSSLTCLASSTTEYLTIKALVADAGTLLLNIPAGKDYGFPTSYIAVSDVRARRLSDKLVGDQLRDVELPFVTVDRPAGGSQSQRTLADLLAFPSLGSLMDAYPDFAACWPARDGGLLDGCRRQAVRSGLPLRVQQGDRLRHGHGQGHARDQRLRPEPGHAPVQVSVTNEAVGTGYTAGGKALTTKTITYAAGSNTTTLDCDDLVWTTTTVQARYLVFYVDTGTAATSPLISYVDFGADVTSTGGSFTAAIPAAGFAQFVAS
jgi:hypothetical protein